uniref:histidine kinase n=1 Tax=Amphora coffeiformis TaxID=265554 RepID=A0A7S3L1K4_9STRA
MAAGTRHYLHRAEEDMAAAQFQSLAQPALQAVRRATLQKLYGSRTLAAVVAHAVPNASTWPFLYVPGFAAITTNLVPTQGQAVSKTSGGLSVAPIVTPQQAPAFEAFAYDYFAQEFGFNNNINNNHTEDDLSLWPNQGRGIFYRDDDKCRNNNGRCHDTTGQVTWNTSLDQPILTPKFLHTQGNHPLLLLNVHADETQGRVVEAGIQCQSQQSSSSSSSSSQSCQAASEMVVSSTRGAGAFVVTPITPANEQDQTVVTGFVFCKINWDELLTGLFPQETSGVDVVISTPTDAYTFTIVQGQLVLVGPGDQHDPSFDDSQQSIDLWDADGFLAPDSILYTLTLYENDAFDEPFHDSTPMVVALGAAGLVLLTSCLFYLYDILVRRHADAQATMLDAKRQFVRFISHEVRTPLNSVVMGLTLLQEEMAQALGFRRTTVSMHHHHQNHLHGAGGGNHNLREKNDDDDDDKEHAPARILEKAKDGEEEEEDDDDDDVEASTNPFRRSSSGQTSDHTQIENWYNVMQEVHANAQSSIDVLNDLLNYDKVESGTLALELTIIPMRQLIEQTVQEFNLPAAQKQMELNVSFSSELSPQSNSNDTDMVGDVVRLTQVLRNLISNAIKFTPRGGSLDIRATTTRATPQERQMAHKFTLKNMMTVSRVRSGTLQLEVQDSGAGMTKAQVSRLFRRGVQFNVNDLQAGQGSGLGLYIAKGIIEQHGGSLTASSQGLGHGSTFVVTLPLHQPTEGSTDTPSSAPPSESSETESTNNHQQQHDKPTAPWNVLVVDDSVSNRRLLSRLLQNRGHVCDEAENGQLALDKIRHAQEAGLPDYDLILLDSEMPVLNGPLTAQTIRKYDGYGKVLIVGITGNILPEDVHYFESCGANRVLGKPIRIDVLEEICREYYCTTMGP